MKLDLTGKRALVCGSTQGIGLACAVELAAAGADVTLLARNVERLKAVAAELPCTPTQTHHWIAADFGDPASVREAVRTDIRPERPFHILINNTGGPAPGTAVDAGPEQFLAAFQAHLICNQLLTQALVPGMKDAKYGRIINIISTSVKQPIPGLGVSNTIRGAVASWAKTLAGELGPFGITVNNVLPGYTATERLSALIAGRAKKQGVSEKQVADELRATIPAGRFAEPEETAAAVAFLASPAAAYINGINLPVDGGRLGTL
ncbi:MAG: SDR family oxidoreductase [Phycisphaerales bacterium]